MNDFNYKQGDKVKYEIQPGLIGFGKIVGCSSNGAPILGKGYIVEPDIPIISEVYPFTNFVVYEQWLTKVEEY